jgi:hypothetical protein
MKFNTVQEVTNWRSFTLNGKTYDLSHLDAQWIEYLDQKDPEKLILYKFVVTYGLHCFTEDLQELSPEERQLLMYGSPRESRPFNLKRYELSKQLPSIIKTLGDKKTLVCHAGYGNFAIVKILDLSGNEVNYFVPFTVFKESKKLRLHVLSAYPKDEGVGKVKKVGFFVIAKNLLHNRKPPKP